MAIQHKDIQEPNIHEPKGVALAPSGTAYMANGNGSGLWRKLIATDLSGITSAASGDKVLIAQGGAFTTQRDFAIGSMIITGNANAFTVPDAVDDSLNTDSDYVLLSGNGAPWQADDPQLMTGVAYQNAGLTVEDSGIYRIEVWGTIDTFPSNTDVIGIKYVKNGTDQSPYRLAIKSNATGDYGLISAFSITNLLAGDRIQIMVASRGGGGVVFGSMRVTTELLKAQT